ncbi:patatin-like phospholipase family protein [Tunturiibacter gelidoferens]|uniref:NTE family protein n=1 Tax=Tunturiibacter lichenicola TaxID=2051959 RepID=A0A7Y9NJ11_9BACT|nr:patatin-like phospholipase family protein [Edaphobacter lichenicola]NYF50042.1 NTE family protein [Edaphobacter lichenicola]
MSLYRRTGRTLFRSLILLITTGITHSQTIPATTPSPAPDLAPATTAPKSQDAAPTASRHPRVALVLEGGGALGFAHIGVLQYLEQHHIPVDLVVGTSMGGLVGGLYATGRTPDEIRELVQDIDWTRAIGGRVPFSDLSYRRKQDRIEYPNRLEFGLRHGISLPEGLNSGHEVGLILDAATLADYNLKSFDDLPVPFRCVATNMNTGKAHVFDNGSLARALRATMSIPAIFVPVVIDGVTYTDGAAVDNLPVDVAKANGADFIIASYLDNSGGPQTTPGSFLATTGNFVSIAIAANEMHSIEAADILITSKLQGFTSSMFTKSSEIIPKGVQAAEAKAKLLDRFALTDAEWATYVAQRNSRRKTEVPDPQFVTVAGVTGPARVEIERSLQQVIHRPINTAFLAKEMTRYVGYGTLNAAGYNLIDRNGATGLSINAYPRYNGPPFLDLAINIDGGDTQDVLFGMAGRIIFQNLGGFRSEWRTDIFFGYSYGVRSEYYRPFTPHSNFFYAPRAYATSSRFDFYNEGSRTSQYQINQNGVGFDVGYTWRRNAELRIGQDEYWYSVSKRVDFDNLSIPPQQQSVSSLRYTYYGTDNAVLPFRGVNTFLRVERHEPSKGNDPFTLAEARVAGYLPLNEKNSVFLTASGGTAFGAPPEVTDLQGFPLGGPFRLGSYGRNELLGTQYWLFQGGYERKIFRLPPLLGEGVYAVGFFEGGKVYNNLNPVDELESEAWDGSVAVIVRTALGPIYIGGAAGNNDHRKWWFGLGHVF